MFKAKKKKKMISLGKIVRTRFGSEFQHTIGGAISDFRVDLWGGGEVFCRSIIKDEQIF